MGLNLPRQQESVYRALSSLSRLQKLRHLNLNLPLTPAELPKVDRAHRNPPWDMSGEPVQRPAPQPAPEISADYCKGLFNHMLGEWGSFNYYSNRPSEYKYMWICRRINDGLPRTWFVRDTSFGYRDEQYEDVLLSHGFAVPWDPSRSAFKTKRTRRPGFKPPTSGSARCGTPTVQQSRRGSCMVGSRRGS